MLFSQSILSGQNMEDFCQFQKNGLNRTDIRMQTQVNQSWK